MIDGLTYSKDGNWKDIKARWLASEESVYSKENGGLEEHVRRRNELFQRLGVEEREWKIYEVKDPSSFLIGPYAGWHAFFDNPQTEAGLVAPRVPLIQRTFAEVVKVRRLITRVGEIMENYDSDIQFVGGYVPNSTDGWNLPFLFDGHHSDEAWSRMSHEKRSSLIESGQRFTIALAVYTEAERQKIYEKIEGLH